tara:strand:+ start:376 stop:492 length:117 start_codon:yes stop_codon:yes gene_type:complete
VELFNLEKAITFTAAIVVLFPWTLAGITIIMLIKRRRK